MRRARVDEGGAGRREKRGEERKEERERKRERAEEEAEEEGVGGGGGGGGGAGPAAPRKEGAGAGLPAGSRKFHAQTRSTPLRHGVAASAPPFDGTE